MSRLKNYAALLMMGMTLIGAAPALAASSTITSEELLPSKIVDASGLAGGDVRVTVARIIRVIMSLLGIVAV